MAPLDILRTGIKAQLMRSHAAKYAALCWHAQRLWLWLCRFSGRRPP
jgi:hypothetical protein